MTERWPPWFAWSIQALSFVIAAMQLPWLAGCWIQAADQPPRDFAQDWCSARHWYDGVAIYQPVRETIARYIYQPKPGEFAYIRHNAHPPASVLVLLPLGGLSYGSALAIWQTVNLLALVAGLLLIARELRIVVTARQVLPAVALLVLFDPVRHQFIQGNWNALLFIGVTLTWVLLRRNQDMPAGICLAVTASLKLYPAFLVLYFLAQRRWRGLVGFILAAAVMQGTTVLVLGWQAFVDYRTQAAQGLIDFQAVWTNGSLLGLAAKLFSPHSISRVHLLPLADAPWLARAGTLMAWVVVTCLSIRCALRARDQIERDNAYGIMLTSSLLLSPLIWIDGILLLGMPIFFLWQQGRSWPRLRLFFAVLFWFLMATQQWILEAVSAKPAGELVFQPWQTLLIFSTFTMSLLGFLFIQLFFEFWLLPGGSNLANELR